VGTYRAVADGSTGGVNSNRGRVLLVWDGIKASFGFLSGVAMLAGVAVGLTLPILDDALNINIPVLSFDSQSAARSLLETIATATTAVAGLSFSVTVVAITLASSQLSPTVLRSFRADRLSQVTLALFLGSFVYSLTLLVRLGVSGEDAEPPNLSMTLAVLLAFAAFGTFAGFIAHILKMLQPSSVIASIQADGMEVITDLYPAGSGAPESAEQAALLAASAIDGARVQEIRAEGNGYLTVIDTDSLISAAAAAGAVIRQRAMIGDYVLPGQVLAEAGITQGDSAGGTAQNPDKLTKAVHEAFVLDKQRSLVQDVSFTVRQLTDIAIKGLSPGINDPTTAENAIEAMGSFLVEFALCGRPAPVRVDEAGEPRLVTSPPDLDDLIRLGFEQLRMAAATHPTVSKRMLALLDLIEVAADRAGFESTEIDRQRGLIEPNSG
jgi:uncharacterized membrane protein